MVSFLSTIIHLKLFSIKGVKLYLSSKIKRIGIVQQLRVNHSSLFHTTLHKNQHIEFKVRTKITVSYFFTCEKQTKRCVTTSYYHNDGGHYLNVPMIPYALAMTSKRVNNLTGKKSTITPYWKQPRSILSAWRKLAIRAYYELYKTKSKHDFWQYNVTFSLTLAYSC